MSQSRSTGWENTTPVAGAVLAITALLVVFTMGHHPTGHGGGHGLSLGNIVHGAMIVFLAAQLWALSVFTLGRGADGWSLAGLVAYAISVIGHVLAATINGFIVPALAGAVDTEASHDLFVLLWRANQAFAALGVHATGAAFLFWSVSLLKSGGMTARLTALAGFAAAIAPSALMLSDSLSLNVAGAFLVYTAHSIWLVILGGLLWRRAL